MKPRVPYFFRRLVVGGAILSSRVSAETSKETGMQTGSISNVWDQMAGIDAPTSEALLLVVFILLVLAVIAHKPKAP